MPLLAQQRRDEQGRDILEMSQIYNNPFKARERKREKRENGITVSTVLYQSELLSIIGLPIHPPTHSPKAHSRSIEDVDFEPQNVQHDLTIVGWVGFRPIP